MAAAEDPTAHRTIPNDYSFYRPLRSEAQDIRLLRILPRDDNDNDGLAVALVRTNLSDHPEYRALSYCWGGLDDLKPLTVVFEDFAVGASSSVSNIPSDDLCRVEFQITTNLHDALVSCRRSKEWGYLWIDMLCINQGDIDERSGQVRFMRSIYESAESVVVWLGTDLDLQGCLFAPENYEIALANLALEESGWTAGQSFHKFLAIFLAGEEGGGSGVSEEVEDRSRNWKPKGASQPEIHDVVPVRTESTCNLAFATLLREAQQVFDKHSIAGGLAEAPEGGLRKEFCEALLAGLDTAPPGSTAPFKHTVLGPQILEPRCGNGFLGCCRLET